MGAYEWMEGIDPASASLTWTGASSTDWQVEGNWNLGFVPETEDDASIPDVTNDLVIGSAALCNDLTIQSGGVVTVDPAGTLSVNGTLTNSAGTNGLVINSTSEGTGKLVNNTPDVEATAKQYISNTGWHYFGIPFSSARNVLPSFKGLWIIQSNESEAENGERVGWTYLTGTNQIVPGKGYGFYHDLDTTIALAGTLFTGNKQVDLAYSGENFGWNMLANPYPCTTDWDEGISKTNIDGAVYVYNPATNNYMSYNNGTATNGGSCYIAPMQGFFVRANAASSSVIFTNATKTTEVSTFKITTVQSIIRLALSDIEGRKDESVIRLHPATTAQFDGLYDAYKLKASTSLTPQLYSVYRGAEYSINSIPEVNDKTVIPLELMIKQTGRHTLSLTELLNYNETLPIVLFDNKGNELVNLLNNSYHFDAKQGDILKFKLAFSYLLASPEIDILNNFQIRVKNRIVEISGLVDKVSEISVYNTKGQLLQSHKVQGDALLINQLPHGVHLLKVTGLAGSVQVKKVVIQ